MARAGRRLATRTPFFYGWVVVGAAGVAMYGGTAAAASTFSIFVKPMSDEFGWSRAAVSGGISFATLVGAFVAPLAGRWLDRYGGRLLLAAGGALMGAALLGMGFIQNLLMFYLLYTVARAVFMGTTSLATTTVVANWFVRRRALATACVLLMDRVGLGTWPVVAALLFSAADWRVAWWVMGSVVLGISVIPGLFIVARRPEEVGLQPDGQRLAPLAAYNLPGGERSSVQPSPSAAPEVSWTTRQAIKTSAFWLLSFSAMATAFAGAGLGVHRVPYFVERGMDEAMAGLLLTCFATGIAVGGFVAARLSTWVPFQRIVALQLAGGALLMPVLMNLPLGPVAFAYAWVEGLVLGGSFTLVPVIFAQFYGRQSLGTIRGITQLLTVVANALGPLVAGVLYDASGQSYAWAFTSIGIVLAAGALAAWLARAPTMPSG